MGMSYHFDQDRLNVKTTAGVLITPSSSPPRFIDQTHYGYRYKRLFDIVVSMAALLILLPFLVLIAALVRLSSPGPAIFWSKRVGWHERIFLMPKFRSMKTGSKLEAREISGESQEGLTSIGWVLRKLSIDELPQLWSVLRGDMSLVGPRPLLANDPTTDIRRNSFPTCFLVRPGISGLAQINGRNKVQSVRKARYDAHYARRCSFGLDVLILMRTVKILFKFDDIV
jgi:O-antigen biosynthesis protein WbqP